MEKYYPYIISGILFIISTIASAALKKWTDELLPSIKTMKEKWRSQKDYYKFLAIIILSNIFVSFLLLDPYITVTKAYVAYVAMGISIPIYAFFRFQIKIRDLIHEIKDSNRELHVTHVFVEAISTVHDLSIAAKKFFESMNNNKDGLTEFIKFEEALRERCLKELNVLEKLIDPTITEKGNSSTDLFPHPPK